MEWFQERYGRTEDRQWGGERPGVGREAGRDVAADVEETFEEKVKRHLERFWCMSFDTNSSFIYKMLIKLFLVKDCGGLLPV